MTPPGHHPATGSGGPVRYLCLAAAFAAATASLVAVGIGALDVPTSPSWAAIERWATGAGVVEVAAAACCALATVTGAWLTAVSLLAGLGALRPASCAWRLAWVLSPPALRLLLALGTTAAPALGLTRLAAAAPAAAASGGVVATSGSAAATGTPTLEIVGSAPSAGSGAGTPRSGQGQRVRSQPAPTMTWLAPPLAPLTGSAAAGVIPSGRAVPSGGADPPPAATAERHRAAPPARTPTGAAAQLPTSWVVRPGDSFWAVSVDLLRSRGSADPSAQQVAAVCDRLVAANRSRLPDPGNPDLLFVGDRLVIPAGLLA